MGWVITAKANSPTIMTRRAEIHEKRAFRLKNLGSLGLRVVNKSSSEIVGKVC